MGIINTTKIVNGLKVFHICLKKVEGPYEMSGDSNQLVCIIISIMSYR